MDISIIGSGYVGLVTGACLADVGHSVVCVDNDQRKVDSLRSGHIPIYEPGLEEVVHRNVSARRLRFTNSIEDGVRHSQIVFIAVPTPPQPDGSVDLTYIERVAREIAEVLKEYRVIVDKNARIADKARILERQMNFPTRGEIANGTTLNTMLPFLQKPFLIEQFTERLGLLTSIRPPVTLFST